MRTILNIPDHSLQDDGHHQKIQALLDLRGKVRIEYDWEQEEEWELKSAVMQKFEHRE